MKGLTFLDKNFRDLADGWVSAMKDAGVEPTVTSTRRSLKEQTALYDAYIHGRSKYPAAYPGTSLHEWGLAFDVEAIPHTALFVLGPLWEKLGFGKWGGRFSHHDEIHFEANEAVKKAAGYIPHAIYEPGLEKNPLSPVDLLTPSPRGVVGLVGSPIVSAAEDFLGKLLGL